MVFIYIIQVHSPTMFCYFAGAWVFPQHGADRPGTWDHLQPSFFQQGPDWAAVFCFCKTMNKASYSPKWCMYSAAMACATWNCCRLVHHTTVSLHCKAAYVRCMHVYTGGRLQCKHACTLRMRLCNEVTQLYGVQDGSSFMWHKPWQHLFWHMFHPCSSMEKTLAILPKVLVAGYSVNMHAPYVCGFVVVFVLHILSAI